MWRHDILTTQISKTSGGSRPAATSKMERFVTIVNGWKQLTNITKHSILDVAAALDPPLKTLFYGQIISFSLESATKKTFKWWVNHCFVINHSDITIYAKFNLSFKSWIGYDGGGEVEG